MTELATLLFGTGGSQRYKPNGLAEFMFYVIMSFKFFSLDLQCAEGMSSQK